MSNNNIHTDSVDLSWLERYRQISVIGLGMSGIGVTKALSERGFALHVQDSRDEVIGLDEIKALENVLSVHVGSFDIARILSSDLLIMSPGVSLLTPEIQIAIDNGVEITSDVDIIARSCSLPIMAITGSNGKSTVTQLAGEMCQAAGYETFIGGNIGRSVMELIDEKAQYDLAVLELSSFQLEIAPNLRASSAVVLNLSPDHLDRYDSYHSYATSKLAIYNNAANQIWNRDDSWLRNVELLSTEQEGRQFTTLSFGLQEPRNNNEFGIVKDERNQRYYAKGQHTTQTILSRSLVNVLVRAASLLARVKSLSNAIATIVSVLTL